MASASSRMISLYDAIDDMEAYAVLANICLVEAKVFICSRTTSIPRSSEALSSRTICLTLLGPYIRRARARMVEVFPVPGGPYSKR